MLVRSLDIKVGARAFAIAAFDHEAVGGAAVEPDVENVVHDLVVGQVIVGAEQRLMIRAKPGVRAAGPERFDDAGIDRRINQIVAALAMDIEGDRHAPGALAADDPVGAALHHGADAVGRPLRHPARVGDGVEREFAQGRAIATHCRHPSVGWHLRRWRAAT